MASLISGDPKDRKTFSLGENYWTDEHNRNWIETVNQLNTVDNELGALGADVSDLTTDVSNLDSRVSNLESFDGTDKAYFDAFADSRAVSKLATAAASGDTTLDVENTDLKLLVDDEVLLYDADDGTVVGPVTVQTELAKDSSGSVLQVSSLPSGTSANTYVMPSLTTLARGAASALESRVSTAESDLSSLEQYVNGNSDGDLQYVLNNMQQKDQTLQALINQEGARISSVQSRMSVAEDQIQLSVTDYGVTDEPIANVDGALSGSAISSVPVRNLNLTVRAEDKLIVANPDGPPTFLDVDTDVAGSGTATIDLATSYDLDLNDGQKVYLAPLSSRSAVEVLQGEVNLSVKEDGVVSALNVSLEDISVDTNYLKSATFDGSVTTDGDGRTIVDTSDLGTEGWALTDGGDIVAQRAFLRGEISASAGIFTGPIEMAQGGQIIDEKGRYRVDNLGFAVAATQSRTFQQGNMFSVLNSNGEVIGRISGKVPGSEIFQLKSRDRLLIRADAEAELRSLANDVRLTADRFVRFNTDAIKATDLKEFSGQSAADTAFSNGNITEGELWTDTANGNVIKKYHDDTSTNNPTNKTPAFDVEVSGFTVFATDESQVDDGGIDLVEWEFVKENGSTATTATGPSADYFFSSSQVVTVKHRVTWSDGTQSTWLSESAQVGIDPPDPIQPPPDDDRTIFRVAQ